MYLLLADLAIAEGADVREAIRAALAYSLQHRVIVRVQICGHPVEIDATVDLEQQIIERWAAGAGVNVTDRKKNNPKKHKPDELFIENPIHETPAAAPAPAVKNPK